MLCSWNLKSFGHNRSRCRIAPAVEKLDLFFELLLANRHLLLVHFVVGAGFLVLHVFGDQVLQVGFGFGLEDVSTNLNAILLLTNSSSSIPSPVYQCTYAFLLYMAENCSPTRLKSDWIEVELQMKVADILRPRGGTSH